MATAASQAVSFEFAKNQIVVSKESADLGSAQESVPAAYTGEPMRAAFNPVFLMDVLKVLDEEEVTIELTSPEKPAVIRLPKFFYLVMPTKL